MNPETRNCRNCHDDFQIEPDDFAFYEKMRVDVPDMCYRCGIAQMMALRNERTLYHRICARCKRDTLSLYHAGAPYVVYCHDCWWTDSWEGGEYGMAYDSSRPFFGQFKELQLRVPREALIILNSVNCDYGNNVRDSKDCYFAFLVANGEKIFYTIWVIESKESMESILVVDSELIFHSFDVAKSYNSVFLESSSNCTDCYFSFDLKGCNNCLFCCNLRGKSYCVRNKQVSKEIFESELKKALNGSHKDFVSAKNEFEKVKEGAVKKYAFISKSNDVIGNHISNCNKSYFVFNTLNSEHAKVGANVINGKEVFYSYAIGTQPSELIFASSVIKGGFNVKNSFNLFNCRDCFLCDSLISCSNCIGCIGLKNKEYCILNKQYTKEEYKSMLDGMESAGELAEFVPKSFSTFSYNETAAQDYFPLTKEEALKRGYDWEDYSSATSGKETIGPEALPDSVFKTNDSITDEILRCVECGRNYKLIKEELSYLRRFALPIPRNCPQCRIAKAFRKILSYKIWHRQCMCEKSNHSHGDRCPNEFETPYSPESKEIVYCESCYNSEVV